MNTRRYSLPISGHGPCSAALACYGHYFGLALAGKQYVFQMDRCGRNEILDPLGDMSTTTGRQPRRP
jgi:hypothetical protein